MILVTGATGFLGKRVARRLRDLHLEFAATSRSLGTDLRSRTETRALFERVRPTKVIHCAAFVGGIQFGYRHPAELFTNNIEMSISLFEACREFDVSRLVNPISNCAYPARLALFREDEFWDGPLHESVLSYGFARKASWVGAWAYAKQYGLDTLNLIISNMYGPEDHFDPVRSHALGALVMKMVEARRSGAAEVVVWGTGTPVREWLYVDDGAEALVRGLEAASTDQPVNVGVASGVSVRDLAESIKRATGFRGRLRFDDSMPDGAPFKTVDGTKGAALLGWSPQVELEEGIARTVTWLEANWEVVNGGRS
jgi:GDP-L-fucose synthase